MCGLFGIINYERDDFDYTTFCTLGVANDRRGGDSCGVFIDGNVEYGIGQKAKFEDFFWDSKLLNETTKCHIALGHDRKASVGGVTLEKAHPIIISESVEVAEGEEPKEEIKFVLVHNGTIYNYEDLAKKYIPDIKITGMSDSQVIALILYHSGFDFLAEYNGGAAFVAVDYRGENPKVYLWRGESKNTEYSVQVSEERPLFVNYTNGRLVFSSILSYLNILEGSSFVITANKVITYEDGNLCILRDIDRSKAIQTREVKIYTNNNSHKGNTNKTTTGYPRDYDDYEDDEYHYGYGCGYGGSYSPVWLNCVELNNKYWIGQKPADGKTLITKYGRIVQETENIATWDPYEVWFFAGIPLKDGKRSYHFINKMFLKTKLELPVFIKMYQNVIRYLSSDGCYIEDNICYQATSPFNRKKFTGDFQMLTKSFKDTYVDGVKLKTSALSVDIEEPFWPFVVEHRIDYKNIWKQFIQSIAYPGKK